MKPTRDEILAEPAGPRLNQWVAEYVMGCREEQNGNGTYDLIVPGGVNQIDFCEPGACWSAAPGYSGEIAAAWQVVEKIGGVVVEDWGTGFTYPRWSVHFKDANGFASGVVWAESPCVALCRAALLAVVG